MIVFTLVGLSAMLMGFAGKATGRFSPVSGILHRGLWREDPTPRCGRYGG